MFLDWKAGLSVALGMWQLHTNTHHRRMEDSACMAEAPWDVHWVNKLASNHCSHSFETRPPASCALYRLQPGVLHCLYCLLINMPYLMYCLHRRTCSVTWQCLTRSGASCC